MYYVAITPLSFASNPVITYKDARTRRTVRLTWIWYLVYDMKYIYLSHPRASRVLTMIAYMYTGAIIFFSLKMITYKDARTRRTVRLT